MFIILLLCCCTSGGWLLADKLLGHRVEHILALLEVGGNVFDRGLVTGHPAFGAVYLGFLLGKRHAFAGHGQLIDHHHQRDQHPGNQRCRHGIKYALL